MGKLLLVLADLPLDRPKIGYAQGIYGALNERPDLFLGVL